MGLAYTQTQQRRKTNQIKEQHVAIKIYKKLMSNTKAKHICKLKISIFWTDQSLWCISGSIILNNSISKQPLLTKQRKIVSFGKKRENFNKNIIWIFLKKLKHYNSIIFKKKLRLKNYYDFVFSINFHSKLLILNFFKMIFMKNDRVV